MTLPNLVAVRRDVLPALAAELSTAQRASDALRITTLESLRERIAKQEPDVFLRNPEPETLWRVGLVVQRVVWGLAAYTITVTAIEPPTRPDGPPGRLWTQREIAWGV